MPITTQNSTEYGFLPLPFLVGRLRMNTRCRQCPERAKRSARLFRVIYEVVSFGTAMGQPRPTIASLKTVIATSPSRAKSLAVVPTNLKSPGRCTPATITARKALSGFGGLRLGSGRKDTNVQQDAYRCLPPGGNPCHRYAG